MTIQQLLLESDLVEGVDYSFINDELLALEKTRTVDEIVHHEEIPAVLGEQGEEISPAIPAWDETIQVQQTYTEILPSLNELYRELVSRSNVSSAIEEYLSDKQELKSNDDSLNVELFLNGGSGWRYQNIAAPSFKQLYDLIDIANEKAEQAEINAEALEYLASTDWMVLREADGGQAMSAEVRAERAAARARVVR